MSLLQLFFPFFESFPLDSLPPLPTGGLLGHFLLHVTPRAPQGLELTAAALGQAERQLVTCGGGGGGVAGGVVFWEVFFFF